ncbi:MAG TPA: hypothetical protein VGK95_10465 [Caldimonas sp.]
MNAKHLLSLSIIAAALAAGIAVQAQAVTRGDTNASVLQARARGELIPAGEAISPFAAPSRRAERTRQDVRDEVLSARASGALVPAGEGLAMKPATTSILTRAEVRESVREARLNGELIPAGEGMGPIESQARAHMARGAFAAYTRR